MAAPAVVAAVAPVAILAVVDNTAIAITIIGAAQALVLAWFGVRQQRAEKTAQEAKTRADRTERDATASASAQEHRTDRNVRLIDQLQEQLDSEVSVRQSDRKLITDLQTETRMMRIQMTRMEIGTARLIAQLEALNIEPVWRPQPEQT